MKFIVLGINHKECPVEVRERLHFSKKQLESILAGFGAEAALSELVILSTCNRVELYAAGEGGIVSAEALTDLLEKTHDIRRDEFASYIYRYEGKDAVRHLFRVAAGLDSLVVGENEILGQVREAFRMANDFRSVHSLLYRLMEKAIKVGKDVRTATKINEGAVSISSVAVELAEKIFGRLNGEKVMVLGTGEMSALTLASLNSAGARALFVVSRNAERGEALAAEYGARWVSLDNWEEHLAAVDILIASTAAPHPIVHYDQVKRVMEARRYRPLFLIDIAVPRDVDASVNSLDDVYVYNIDDLKGVAAANLRLRRGEMQAAEERVERAVVEYQAWLEQLKARPVLEQFEKFVDEILDREFSTLQEKALDAAAQERLKQRIRAKLMHAPLEKIKDASKNGGVSRYLEALHSLFNLDDKNSKS